MSQLNNRIKVADLEFDSIKQNLKDFLKGQEEFSDYNYEGSALSVLIDLLAYNTHYNTLYTNMAINEMFLDSATKRSSILSIANNFGYSPRTVRGAVATLQLRVDAQKVVGTPSNLILPKYTQFTTSVNNTVVIFRTTKDYVSNPKSNGYYVFDNVEIHEGDRRYLMFVCTQQNQKFIIPYSNIDSSTLIVQVQETVESPEIISYQSPLTIVDLDSDSPVYYLKELDSSYYELSFGQNNLGKNINPGNVVTLSFIEPKYFQDINGAAFFTCGDYQYPLSITTISSAAGGSQKESNDDIKINTSNHFFSQNRAVTANDYAHIINKHYSDIDSIAVWGGENNTPPEYGKIFISIKPESKNTLSESEKQSIIETIKPYHVVSTIVEFSDPTIINTQLNVLVNCDLSNSSRSAEDIKTSIKQIIESYRQTNLQKHNGNLYISRLMNEINNVDLSIKSNDIKMRCFISVKPIYNIPYNYHVNFENEIIRSGAPSNIISSAFFIKGSSNKHFIDDDGNGKLRLMEINEQLNQNILINSDIGKVDYDKGIVSIVNLEILRIFDQTFEISMIPRNSDLYSKNNKIIDIDQGRTTVIMRMV